MKDFKIGGKVTINKDESYIIIDIISINNKIYYLCSTNKKPVTPKVFEREEEGEKVFIKFVEDKEILKQIAEKVLEKNE